MKNRFRNKLARMLITTALVIATTLPLLAFAEVAQYRDGSEDEYWTSGSMDTWSDADIAAIAETGGFSSAVLQDILNSGRCHAYIDTWKAMGEIPQDFYPSGSGNSSSNSTQSADTSTSAPAPTPEPTPATPTYTEEEIANAWKETSRTDATCTDDGTIKYKNTLTGKTKSETIKATGHTYEPEVTDATCTESGKTTYTCSVCGDTYEEVIDALGHTAGDWYVEINASAFSSGEKVQKCTVCGEVLNTETIPQTFPLPLGAVISIAVVAVACIGGVTAIVVKKKRSSNENKEKES